MRSSPTFISLLLLSSCATPHPVNEPGKTESDHRVAVLTAEVSAIKSQISLLRIIAQNPPRPSEPPATLPAEPLPVADSHPHWTYDGEEGPLHWAELDENWATCAAGKKQSPVNLELRRSGKPSEVKFSYQPSAARVVDNGHTLQVNLARGSFIVIEKHRYNLVQFHVHTPSEHTIAGERYPLELHLVHQDARGKLAVVGVLFELGESSSALTRVWQAWPATHGREMDLGVFDPQELLPDQRTVFRYEGSLTTPPCTEGVVWSVLRHTRSESRENIDALRKHYPWNARPVLALGKRKVQ